MYDVDRHLALRRVTRVEPHPEGEWAAVELQRLSADGVKYVAELWRVSVGCPSEAPELLTQGDHGARAPSFRADGALGFLAARPRPGAPADEPTFAQVWLLPARGGEAVALTDEPLGVQSFRFAGDRLVTVCPVLPGVPLERARAEQVDRTRNGPSALHYTAHPVRHWDEWVPVAEPHVVVRATDGSDRRDLTPDVGGALREAAWAVARDGGTVAITRSSRGADGIDEHSIVLIDTGSGRHTVAHARPGRQVASLAFSADGARLAACVEDRRPKLAPSRSVIELDLRGGGEPQVLPGTEGETPHDVVYAAGAWHTTIDVRGAVAVHTLDAARPAVRRTERGSWEGLAALPGAGGLLGIHHRLDHPPEVYQLPLEGPPRALAGLSGFEAGEAAIEVEELAATGADGVEVHGFVVRPAGPVAVRPGLVWVHGGPIGAWADGWQWRWTAALAAARGHVVGLPNPRGSTGYGQRFIDGVWDNQYGGACADDVLAWGEAFAALPDVDAARLAAMGGSFGGYMVNWLGGHTDRFRCLVSHAGLWDLRSFLATDLPEWWIVEQGGSPWADPEAFDRYSPHRFAPRWRSPVLLIHGERDYRVPVGEALLAFQALRFHRVEAELLVFPDENHWILKPRNIRAWYGAVLAFLDRHLTPSSSASSSESASRSPHSTV